MEKSQELAIRLLDIQKWDEHKDYKARNHYIYMALALAYDCDFAHGIRIDPEEPEWPVAFIELPTGQVSYHLPQHATEWDGHTTEQKQIRILKWIADVIR